jgi:3',5'-cyclic AMP phosphodiesterase CpdA
MRIALLTDTHLSPRAPECQTNWEAARRAVSRMGAELTLHLGDLTLDGHHHPDELAHAARLVQDWPHPMLVLPGNHDVGDGSGEQAFDAPALARYRAVFGRDHWALQAGRWLLLGINAQLMGTHSAEEAQQWQWLEDQAAQLPADHSIALFSHRPLARQHAGEQQRRNSYVPIEARDRLLRGALRHQLRLVASGHLHQYLDHTVAGLRHLWLPSCAFVMGDDVQSRLGEKVVGLGLLELGHDDVSIDLCCPQGLRRWEKADLGWFRQQALERERARGELMGREAS